MNIQFSGRVAHYEDRGNRGNMTKQYLESEDDMFASEMGNTVMGNIETGLVQW